MKTSVTEKSVAIAPSMLREMNREQLYRTLFRTGPVTRPQLATALGLSQPTVIAVLGDLEKAGLARVAGRPGSASGRPAYLYEANPQAGAVAAVDIGREWIRVVIADLAGDQLAQLNMLNTADSACSLITLASEAVSAATDQADLSRESLTHCVIGSPGVFDPQRGRISLAANLPGWVDADLASTLAAEFGESLTVENDANLAAIGEHAVGAGQGIDNFAYLQVGTGVGLGLVLNGAIYHGARRSAGEVGYLPALVGPSGGPYNLDRGALEEGIAADAVVRTAVEAGMAGTPRAETVFRRAAAGDPAAQAAVRTEGELLAYLVSTIAAMLDPEVIVFGGGVGQNLEAMRPHLVAKLAELTPLQPSLRTGELGADAVSRGAIVAGLERARSIALARAAG